MKIRLQLIAAAVVFVVCGGAAPAQTQSNVTATVAITVSNRSDADLFLSLSPEMQMFPPPPPPLNASPAPSLPPPPLIVAHRTNKTVKASTSTILNLVPGQYYLSANTAHTPPDKERSATNAPKPIQIQMPATGYFSFMNSETWVFEMPQTNFANPKVLPPGSTWWQWVVEIPSRPEFHLANSPQFPTGPTAVRPTRRLPPNSPTSPQMIDLINRERSLLQTSRLAPPSPVSPKTPSHL